MILLMFAFFSIPYWGAERVVPAPDKEKDKEREEDKKKKADEREETWEDFVLNPLTRWESQLDEVCLRCGACSLWYGPSIRLFIMYMYDMMCSPNRAIMTQTAFASL
jgi:hypothetical protein